MRFGKSLKLEFDSDGEDLRFRCLVNSLKNRLNLLVVCLSQSWGGLEQVAANDALDMGDLGFQVKVLCLRESPLHLNMGGRKEVGLLPLDYKPRNYIDLRMRGEIYHRINEGISLVHTHQTSLLGSLSPWLWSHPKVALLATRHIMNNHNKKDFIHRAIYSRVDWLLVMSRTLRDNVLQTHAIRERSLKVVNLGLDFDLFDPGKVNAERQRAAWGADSQTLVIGLVGRIDPAKGQATFIRAAGGILKSLRPGEKLKFVIVGGETLGTSGTYLEELKQMVIQFRIEEFVVFAGFQENIPEVMRAFDIFVMPSRQEAFGLVAIEAMAMERPIVISSGGSAEEIVGMEEFGLMVRPNDSFDLQRQLRYFLDHPHERVKMGLKARVHVRTHYDRRKRVIKTLGLYERALKRRGSL